MQKVNLLIWLLGGLLLFACGNPVPAGGTYAWIDAPTDGLRVPADQPLQIEGHAAYRDGVARVEIWVNGELHLVEENPPSEGNLAHFEQSWMPPGPGDYTIQVLAIGADGSSSAPDFVRVHVGEEVPLGPHFPEPVAPTSTPTVTPTGTVTVTPTVTPTGTPTTTPTLTPTGTPTSTPTPTVTPTMIPPTEVSFWVEQDSITSGECTVLHWDVEHATAVHLEGEGVAGHGTREICPTSTTTYHLHVEAPSGTVDRSVTVTVSAPVDTTPPPAPSPQVPADGLALPTCVSSQTLAWLPVTDPSGILGYYVKLERRASETQPWQSVGGWGPVSDKQVNVSVECGWYYRWAVRAQDGAGNYGDWSGWFHFSVPLM